MLNKQDVEVIYWSGFSYIMEFYFGLNIAADQIVKDERKY
jgi:hypothetical protein